VSARASIRRVENALARRVRRRVLRPLERGVIARRPRAHLLHVSKAGGTMLKELLGPHTMSGRYELVLHPHPVRFRDIPIGEKVFFVVRDPLERYVSAFNYRLREGRPHQYDPWSDAERIAFEAFQTPDALGAALSSGDADTRARARAAMIAIRHVRDSYWRWFDSLEYLGRRHDDLLLAVWLPDLTATVPQLLTLLGLPETLAVPQSEASANRSPDEAPRALGAAATANLRQWYGADDAFLDYCAGLAVFAGPSWSRDRTSEHHRSQAPAALERSV
jgi:hypothetical protein